MTIKDFDKKLQNIADQMPDSLLYLTWYKVQISERYSKVSRQNRVHFS